MGVARRQLVVLRAVDDLISVRGISPSLAEVARAVGSSVPTVHEHVRQLRAKRLLRRGRRYGSRELELTAAGEKAARSRLERLKETWRHATPRERGEFRSWLRDQG